MAVALFALAFGLIHLERGALEVSASGTTAVLALVLAAPIPYRSRATAMALIGAAIFLEGFFRRGPAFGLAALPGTTLERELARAVAATLLPAALLFRASYRAYPLARRLLAGALITALPFVARSVQVVVLSGAPVSRIAAAATLGAVLLSLVGFMGSGTTAMGNAWAVAIVVVLGVEIAVPASLGSAWLLPTVTALAFLSGAALATMGIFQLTAYSLGPDARRIDVSKHAEPASERSDED